ncbi:MAG: alpha/beta hydrolase [bacterium]|nr:alpha/beta hydrolase [bacterium]
MSDDPTERIVALPKREVDLAVLDWGGSGPVALLAHANGFCAGLFDPVARGLTQNFRVLGFDSRGHGASSRPPVPEGYQWGEFVEDLIAISETLLEELGAKRIALAVGHSFGGTTTLVAAARRSDIFDRVALLDPVVIPQDLELEMLRNRAGGVHPMAEIARKRRDRFESRETARASWQGRGPFADWTPHALDLYLRYGLRDRPEGGVELSCPREVEAAVFDAGPSIDTFAEAAEYRGEGLLLRAAQGNFPRQVYERLVEIAPSIELDEIDAGHLLPMIVPDQVTARLLEFGTG